MAEKSGVKAGDEGLHQMDLNLYPNEASGLLTVQDERLLQAHGWDVAFWVVMDEGRVEECVGIIGHESGAGIETGWKIDRFLASPTGDSGKTEDCEAVAWNDGWVYIFGSHFGSKRGPLEPKRGFIARFREDEVDRAFESPAVELEIYRESFAMHRLINDALKRAVDDGELELVGLGPESYEALILATIRNGERKGKRWAGRVLDDDYPLNFEGAAFRENGNLLFGLRFPTTADGRAILVEMEGIERLFGGEDSGPPEIVGLKVVDAIGRGGEMAGVRDLAIIRTDDGEELHLVTGNVDSKKSGSVLIRDYPPGHDTIATHFECILPEARNENFVERLEGKFVREFPDLPRVEGIAITDDERFFYVTDEDEGVHLRLTRLLADPESRRD